MKIGKHSFFRLGVGIAVLGAALANAAVRGSTMTNLETPDHYSHQTAPTLFIDAGGNRLAYRRFGNPTGTPILFFQHYAGNMDNWDPMIIDGIARDREVILFDNAGIAKSAGEVPDTIDGMARVAIALLDALKVRRVDLLGFSTGSLVAQEVTLQRPGLVRRLVLIGSAPRGGVGMAGFTPEFQAMLDKKRDIPDELLLDTLFTQSLASQTAGRAFLKRIRARKIDRDTDVTATAASRQKQALASWGAPHPNSSSYLKRIKQPVLLVDGSNDVVFYTVNAIELQRALPNAQLIIYPDSNHGALYQYPGLFLEHLHIFLLSPDDRE